MWRHRPIKPRQEQNRRKTNADRTARPLTRRHNCSVDKFRLLAINAVARHDYGLLDVALCHSIGRDSAIGKQNFASVTCDNPERPRLKMYPSLSSTHALLAPWRYDREDSGPWADRLLYQWHGHLPSHEVNGKCLGRRRWKLARRSVFC